MYAAAVALRNMKKKSLTDILPSAKTNDTEQGLRWRAVVPMGTNPFLALDFFLFSVMGAALVLTVLVSGVWITDGLITTSDLQVSISVAFFVFLGIMAGYVVFALFAFGNRYFALYQFDADGIYHESSRGTEKGGQRGFWRMRPYPVTGEVLATRTKDRTLAWEKVDRFQHIPSMRVIHLKRGFWHMLRLYTPDDETHSQVVRYLEERLGPTR